MRRVFLPFVFIQRIAMFRLWKNMYMSEWIYVYRHSAICIYMYLFMILDPNLTIKVRLNWQKKG